jgi:predicted N-acetyltransferase YhbS
LEVSEEPQQDHGSLDPQVEIRQERPEDFDAIRSVVREAFGRDFESIVVDRLRASDDYLPGLSLVAVLDDQVVGHIMVTAQAIIGDGGEKFPSTILAPLAIDPEYQGQGLGQALTRAALDAARRADCRSMVLIGHPTYYPRFGFRPASSWGIRYATPIPDDVFMAIELAPGGLDNARGTVTISPAFDEPQGRIP